MGKGRRIIIILAIFVSCLVVGFGFYASAATKTKISNKKLTIQVGSTKKLSIIKGNKKIKASSIKWKSKNKKIATVSKKGKVTAKSKGKTTITAKVKKKKYTCKIIVINQSGETIVTNGGDTISLASLKHYSPEEANSTVYYTPNITASSLVAIYDKLGFTPTGKVAVKLSTGEPPASNYLEPKLIKDLVKKVNGTIVECNTAYGGSRSSTKMHYQVAKDHGFTDIAPFQILDEKGSMSIPVKNGKRLSEDFVGKAFKDYDSYVVLSHFKGHSMAGYGGAIKNISIGLGSTEGKCWIHSSGTSKSSPWGGEQDPFLESMADAGKAVSDYLGNGERIVYISVMNRLSIDCDCNGNPAEPDMHDIGILASTDPVALDQACLDLIWVSDDNESFIKRVNSRNGLHTLESAEKNGLGNRTYHLVDVK